MDPGEALIDRFHGLDVLRSAHLVVLDTRRAVRRHVPDTRGYWGT